MNERRFYNMMAVRNAIIYFCKELNLNVRVECNSYNYNIFIKVDDYNRTKSYAKTKCWRYEIQNIELDRNDIRFTIEFIKDQIRRAFLEKQKKYPSEFDIEEVIFNGPATIIKWCDGTKTVVKLQDDDTYDAEKGLAMAIAKKALGNDGSYYDVFSKHLPQDENNETDTAIPQLDKKDIEKLKKICEARWA